MVDTKTLVHDALTQHASLSPVATNQAALHSPVLSCGMLSIERHLERSASTLKQTALQCQPSIQRAAEIITACFQRQNKLLLCGNGGSAAECQHMAAELTHRLSAAVIRRALPALALTTDTSFLTACSNDDGFRHVFARQIEALGQPGDVLLAISTSGNSENVVAAIEQARAQGLEIISLCGQRGQLPSLSDTAICIPADDTQSIQEAHLAIVHILCGLVELAFVRSNHNPPR